MTMNIDALADSLIGDIDKKGKVVKLPTKYVMPGRGRKQCPECQVYVGVRTQECECGHEFVPEDRKTPAAQVLEEPLSDEDKRYVRAIGCGKGGRIIYAGSGPCPATLRGVAFTDVSTFCDDVVFAGMAQGKIYLPKAIKCWVRHIIGDKAESLTSIYYYIDKWYDEKVVSTMIEEQ